MRTLNKKSVKVVFDFVKKAMKQQKKTIELTPSCKLICEYGLYYYDGKLGLDYIDSSGKVSGELAKLFKILELDIDDLLYDINVDSYIELDDLNERL